MRKYNSLKDVIIFIFSALTILLIVVILNIAGNNSTNSGLSGHLKEDLGESVNINVDSPFLLSIVTELTEGTNAKVILGDNNSDLYFSIFNQEGQPSFDNVKQDVLLMGENSLHDIKINDYDKNKFTSPIPDYYKNRNDRIEYGKYYLNPENLISIVEQLANSIYEKSNSNTINKNKREVLNKIDVVKSNLKTLGLDYKNPALFFIGDTTYISFLQEINPEIKIISYYDSKSINDSDTFNAFNDLLNGLNAKSILVSDNADKDVVAMIRKRNPNIDIVYLEDFNSIQTIEEYYDKYIDTIESTLLDM